MWPWALSWKDILFIAIWVADSLNRIEGVRLYEVKDVVRVDDDRPWLDMWW